MFPGSPAWQSEQLANWQLAFGCFTHAEVYPHKAIAINAKIAKY